MMINGAFHTTPNGEAAVIRKECSGFFYILIKFILNIFSCRFSYILITNFLICISINISFY